MSRSRKRAAKNVTNFYGLWQFLKQKYNATTHESGVKIHASEIVNTSRVGCSHGLLSHRGEVILIYLFDLPKPAFVCFCFNKIRWENFTPHE